MRQKTEPETVTHRIKFRKTVTSHWAPAILAASLTGVVSLAWGGMGLPVLVGRAAGHGLPFLLGPSKPPGDDANQGMHKWKWDGSPDDGGDSFGDGIFKD